MSNHQLGKELHKTVIRKLDKRKIRQSFKDNIYGADRLDMQLYAMICVIDIYNKYTCVIPLKDKKGIAITNPFQKVLDESDHNSNKIWVDRGSEYYNTYHSTIKMKPFDVKSSIYFDIGKKI